MTAARTTASTTCSDAIFFSTSLIGRTPPPLDAWPYYAPETGQHIAFCTEASLQALAGRLGLHLCSNDIDHHRLTGRPVSPRLFRDVLRPFVSRCLAAVLSWPTLLYRDFATGREAALRAMRGPP